MQNLLIKIFFLDIPSLIDSAWRRIDFRANAERYYVFGDPGHLEPRPLWRTPPFLMFAFLVFFVSYGPNFDSLCAIAPEPVVRFLRWGLGLSIAVATVVFAYRYRGLPGALARRRFDRLNQHDQASAFRKRIVIFGTQATALVALVPFLKAASYIAGFGADPATCAVEGGDLVAFLRFALCGGTVVAIAVLGSRVTSTALLLRIQVAAIILVALVHWFLLAGPSTREVSDLPYRHVFAFWAPCIAAVLLLAPNVVKLVFPAERPAAPGGGTAAPADPNDLRTESVRFRQWLAATELFANRVEPVLSWRRLFFALIYGPAYHPLHLLLIPAWAALVASPQWLYLSVVLALVFSSLLLVWGNVSVRWEEMNVHINRWFLSGAPLIVSVLVVALAVMRVLQFDYISTILDALPFGTIFGMIVMTYMLFWFSEYWMNRVLAVRLLRILGSGGDELAITYPHPDPVAPDIRVAQEGRFVVLHGTGRFIALGTWPPPAGGQPAVAFNSFYFTEVFSRLGELARTDDERTYPRDIERRIGNFFFSLNIAMAAVTVCFLGYYAYNHNFRDGGIDAVLTTPASPKNPASVDLAALLEQRPDQPPRPAIVVVGSGGGTRAALYTATVLRGLHRLGVDQDVVLLSGVSGGGVALTYFAANRDALIAQGQDDSIPCIENPSFKRRSGNPWNCFEKSMTEPFIEDVLNGATEWRVFSQTALSTLLAESFKRRLFGRQSLGSIFTPALILNSAIVSHPWDDSDLLRRTLDKPPGRTADDPDCEEEERSYKLMSGGRLVFTNVRDTQQFPQRQMHIADVQLPYQVIRDANVPLATAAALNANFPPVFPSARVRMEDADASACRFKDYYVTDGGAVENLGLISAIYALQSAIGKLTPDHQVRPIHIVLAEASAISYDYGQDRGLSAIEGSRERLAGGLTGTLIAELEQQLAARGASTPKVKFHYLGLPLAFRARGGFGTHWMYAKAYHLSDPRPRSIPLLNFLPGALGRDRKAAIDQPALRELWLALHNPDMPFCDPQTFSGDSKKVWTWVCGSPNSDPDGRDLHMQAWQTLVKEMRAIPK
jgi:hypothetical protein